MQILKRVPPAVSLTVHCRTLKVASGGEREQPAIFSPYSNVGSAFRSIDRFQYTHRGWRVLSGVLVNVEGLIREGTTIVAKATAEMVDLDKMA